MQGPQKAMAENKWVLLGLFQVYLITLPTTGFPGPTLYGQSVMRKTNWGYNQCKWSEMGPYLQLVVGDHFVGGGACDLELREILVRDFSVTLP